MLDIIIGFAFGILVASYSSSIFFRLPRNIKIYAHGEAGYKPFCSVCRHPLKPYEYYSVISWIYCLGKCSYCGHKIDLKYIISESFVILSSTLFAWKYGISDNYLILFIQAITFIIIFSIYFSNFKIHKGLYITSFIIATIYNTMIYGGITEWLSQIIFLSFPILIVSLAMKRADNAYFPLIMLFWGFDNLAITLAIYSFYLLSYLENYWRYYKHNFAAISNIALIITWYGHSLLFI